MVEDKSVGLLSESVYRYLVERLKSGESINRAFYFMQMITIKDVHESTILVCDLHRL